MACCRDCELYDLDAVRSKSGAVLSNRQALCRWSSTEVWPASVGWRVERATGGVMAPNDGAGCQRFIKRDRP